MLFFCTKAYTGGYALSVFLTASFSLWYIWRFVLRVSEASFEHQEEKPPASEAKKHAAESTRQSSGTGASAAKRDSPTAAKKEAPDSKPSAPRSANVTSDDSRQGSSTGGADSSREPVKEGGAETKSADEEQEDGPEVDFEKSKELREQGNGLFKTGQYDEALEVYAQAVSSCPRSEKKHKGAIHSNRAACFQHQKAWEQVIAECSKAIECDPKYVKAYHRRCSAAEALEKWHDAATDLKKVLELDPAQKSKMGAHLATLERKSNEQFEKDKEEMLGKLKDLGNMVLGKFGMSVDNFAVEKDPNTGSYSMSYKN